MPALVPGWPWVVDEGRLYWGMKHVTKADLASFQPLNDFWGRDASRVYCAGSEMRDADLDTFHVLNKLYAKDSRHAYTPLGPIKEADADSFEAIGPIEHPFNTFNSFAKDKRFVYHTWSGGKACILKGADSGSFSPCGHGYGRDESSVYFERKKLASAQSSDWQYIRGPHSRAAKNGYWLGKRISGADGRSLESLPIIDSEYWCRDHKGYYLDDKPGDPRKYLEQFRQCFVFVGKVSSVSLTWKHTYPLPSDQTDSWSIADHAWISVICKEWLQKPDIEIEAAELPKIGEPFRFGQGVHLGLLAPPDWMNEDRIWIFTPNQDYKRVEKRLVLLSIKVWWEYTSLDQLEFLKDLIVAANSP
jgi:hypothetical protein